MELLAAVILALVAAWLTVLIWLWLVRPRDAALAEIVRLVPDVARLVRGLLTDRATPTTVRIALVVLIIWLVSPIDLIPEFVPVLGLLDDAIVAVVVLRFVRGRLGDEALRTRWPGSPAGWNLLARLIGAAR